MSEQAIRDEFSRLTQRLTQRGEALTAVQAQRGQALEALAGTDESKERADLIGQAGALAGALATLADEIVLISTRRNEIFSSFFALRCQAAEEELQVLAEKFQAARSVYDASADALRAFTAGNRGGAVGSESDKRLIELEKARTEADLLQKFAARDRDRARGRLENARVLRDRALEVIATGGELVLPS
jgi:hypothetical protein